MNYCNAKMAITLTNLGYDGPRLTNKLLARCYINDRRPGIGTFHDTSRLRIGRNSFVNRLEMLKKVNFSWTNGISPHLLRQNLKKCFFINQAWFLCQVFLQLIIPVIEKCVLIWVLLCLNHGPPRWGIALKKLFM